jgi:hypothetical protein
VILFAAPTVSISRIEHWLDQGWLRESRGAEFLY